MCQCGSASFLSLPCGRRPSASTLEATGYEDGLPPPSSRRDARPLASTRPLSPSQFVAPAKQANEGRRATERPTRDCTGIRAVMKHTSRECDKWIWAKRRSPRRVVPPECWNMPATAAESLQRRDVFISHSQFFPGAHRWPAQSHFKTRWNPLLSLPRPAIHVFSVFVFYNIAFQSGPCSEAPGNEKN